jgi:hypothetical protein
MVILALCDVLGVQTFRYEHTQFRKKADAIQSGGWLAGWLTN